MPDSVLVEAFPVSVQTTAKEAHKNFKGFNFYCKQSGLWTTITEEAVVLGAIAHLFDTHLIMQYQIMYV